MPGGSIHYAWWKRVTPIAVVTAVTIGVTSRYVTGGGVMLGYVMGRYLSPDLDQISLTKDEGRMLHDFKLIGAIMVSFWFPYAYMARWVGGHRSFWTHFPVISTAIRLIYLFIPLMIYEFSWFKNESFLLLLLGIWIGLSISDFTHWALDMLWK